MTPLTKPIAAPWMIPRPTFEYGPAFSRWVRSWGMHVLLLSLLAGVLFFYRLGERELNASHEARAAQNAAMILRDGPSRPGLVTAPDWPRRLVHR